MMEGTHMRFAILVAVAALAGCKAAPVEQKAPETVAAKPMTAEEIAKDLKAKGLPIDGVRVETEVTDTNHLLGRPGQYVSKVMFIDTRHKGVENTIETFANPADATRRNDYIEAVTKGMPIVMQYMLLKDSVLVRLDKEMLPSEVKAYEAALGIKR